MKRRAAATGNRRGSSASARAKAGPGVDRPGQSAAAEPFRWWGKEGWARPRKHRTFWHYWRHGHTLCGAYRWSPFDGDPKLRENAEGYRCRKCELRRTKHRGRRLWRDHKVRPS